MRRPIIKSSPIQRVRMVRHISEYRRLGNRRIVLKDLIAIGDHNVCNVRVRTLSDIRS